MGNKKVYHMDIDEILGKNPLKTQVTEVQMKRFGDETKAGPQINKYLDEININLNVSYFFPLIFCRISKTESTQ